ncbi:hypothetical protein COO59_04635 [Mixta theicola]|uniref:Uncharacterized protein n=1 Tax=Mixta theicola TaxID=1458355 RepID=A0A2K1QDV6_9GAMM|nr:hypothetical protein [Mixta theicola]PNS13195.1 hypothetical protein COO59_04635 [Mixta theicola]GLR09475.1 hypothetical protein GCM10007905_21950 [Mixta theicola]
MSEIISLLSGGWSWVLGGLAIIIGFVGSYFGGKKIGKTQEKARADVAAAQLQTQQAEASTQKQADNIKVAKHVETSNVALSDAAARDKLRQSKYNLDD